MGLQPRAAPRLRGAEKLRGATAGRCGTGGVCGDGDAGGAAGAAGVCANAGPAVNTLVKTIARASFLFEVIGSFLSLDLICVEKDPCYPCDP